RRGPQGDPSRATGRGDGDAGDAGGADHQSMSEPPTSGAPVSGRGLPTGTGTFLRTDVEGSMGLTQALGERWDDVNARHVALIREAVDAPRGPVGRTEGDAVFAAFQEAGAAVAAASAAQRSLQAHDWPDDARL